jgi:HEAT repeat protein
VKSLVCLLLLSPLLTAAEQPPAGAESKVVQRWCEELKSKEFRQQWHAAYVLGTLGPQAAEAVPALHAVLDVKSGANEYARSMAAWALGRIGPAAESEIPFLIETMHATKLVAVRRSTAVALGNFGPAAKAAVSELVKMLGNEDEIVRVNAAVALWKIKGHPKAVPALLEMLRRAEPAQAYPAAVALGQMEKEADTVAPALIDALHSPSADVRRAASRSLGQLGKAAFPALGKARALKDKDPEARRLVIEALSWMGPIAVPALIAALKDESPPVRQSAARALGNVGDQAKAALAALEAAASDPQEEVRTAAAKALQQIRGG